MFEPQPVPFPDGPVTHVDCGGGHTLVVSEAGRLWACGSNSCGQLGLGHFTDVHKFEQVSFFSGDADADKVVSLAACGEEFSAAVTRGKAVYTWGLGVAGQLGDGQSQRSRELPYRVVPLDGLGIEALQLSQGQVLAVTQGGQVYTWGTSGERSSLLDSNLGQEITTPVRVGVFSSRKRVRAISCGRKHYTLITYQLYAPLCSLSLQPSSRGRAVLFPDAATKTTHEKADKTGLLRAGEMLKLTLVGRDARGEALAAGGTIFRCNLQRQPDALSLLALSEANVSASTGTSGDGGDSRSSTRFAPQAKLQPLESFDNMDGTYEISGRLHIAGTFQLSIQVGTSVECIAVYYIRDLFSVVPFRTCLFAQLAFSDYNFTR